MEGRMRVVGDFTRAVEPLCCLLFIPALYSYVTSARSIIKISIVNKETWKDDTIGAISFPISSMLKNPTPTRGKWFQLIKRSKGAATIEEESEHTDPIELSLYMGFAEPFEPFPEEELESEEEVNENDKQSKWKLKLQGLKGHNDKLVNMEASPVHDSKSMSNLRRDFELKDPGIAKNTLESNRRAGSFNRMTTVGINKDENTELGRFHITSEHVM
jgi:hypothetical protein